MTTRLILALVLLVCPGCGSMSSQVEVWNKSGITVRDVDIDVGGNRLHVDVIAPDDGAALVFSAKEDSSLGMAFRSGQESGRRSCQGDVYVTGGSRDKLLVVLNPDGGCQIQSVP